MKHFIAISFFISFWGSALAQQDSALHTRVDTVNYYDMSLEQLLNLKAHGVPSELETLINTLISSASKKPLSARESPGIVSLITEEEIKSSGARDLMDVLRLVPGIDFGMDVEGVVGIGTRGLWAHEGKMLLMIDGQVINENLFATSQYGHHFPVEHIKKIEIIRGPGSAIYGGYAEYGVINIVTKNTDDLQGVLVSGTYGQLKNTFGRKNISLQAAKTINSLKLSLALFNGISNRSNRNYYDLYGNSYDMAENSNLNNSFANLGLAWKNFSVRTIVDMYSLRVADGYDKIEKNPYTMHFNSVLSEIKYIIQPANKKWNITPKINYTRQVPWKSSSVDNNGILQVYDKTAQRFTGNITTSYNLTRKINVIAGGEWYLDKATDNTDSSFFSHGKKTVLYSNQAYFIQGLIKTYFFNIILGARYDNHSSFGAAFAPRIGLTKKINRFHFKALYSSSFRSPSIENINLSTNIKPESTQEGEVELGYQLWRNIIATVNVFDISTKDPIVYYDSLGVDNYKNNFFKIGARGIETEYRVKEKWGFVVFNYSYYTASGKNSTPDYSVPGNNTSLLAFPAHKFNLSAGINLASNCILSPTLSYIGKRYGYTSVDTLGSSLIHSFNPLVLANLYLNFPNLFAKRLSVGLGCFNLLNATYSFIQPYNGYHAPLPSTSREFTIRMVCHFFAKEKKKQ